MANVLANIARMTTETTGTGTITLADAVTGFLTFAGAGITDGQTVTYAIEENNQREIGAGTYTASGTTLSRDTVYNSTNAGSEITLEGTAEVFITAAAEDITSLAGPEEVADRTALKLLQTSVYTAAILRESGREGLFLFRSVE